MDIPFFTLDRQLETHKKLYSTAIERVLKSGQFIAGPIVCEFEEAFSRYLGAAEPMVSCGNGTDALEIILETLGIGPGDEVIVPAMTWISTSEAVVRVGATVVFADVNPSTGNLDPSVLSTVLTSNTKAVIAVHLYGSPADLADLTEFCTSNHLYLIEDCAQAHGATYRNNFVGTFGNAAAFSFYPTKVLGCLGDGGAMLFKSVEHTDRARRIQNLGQLTKRHQHAIHGRNSRLDPLQASILSAKLLKIEEFIKARRKLASLYSQLLASVKELDLPEEADQCRSVFYTYTIQTRDRQELKAYLELQGIQTQLHYPKALPHQDCYRSWPSAQKNFPGANQVATRNLSLPLFPELTEKEIRTVAQGIKTFFKNRGTL